MGKTPALLPKIWASCILWRTPHIQLGLALAPEEASLLRVLLIGTGWGLITLTHTFATTLFRVMMIGLVGLELAHFLDGNCVVRI